MDNNILLIIDPQNDFTPNYIYNENVINKNATLPVDGAVQDYNRIIDFLKKNNNNINEIHVSLDTHTKNHIAHCEFWKIFDDKTNTVNENEYELLCNNNIYSNIIKKGGIISTTQSNKSFLFNTFNGDNSFFITPKYNKLLPYVTEYINFYNDENKNKHNQKAYIWPDHCIVNTDGHKIYKPLQDILNSSDYKNKVIYHIKGQNQLTEMFSIFSAEFSIEDYLLKETLTEEEKNYIYNYLYDVNIDETDTNYYGNEKSFIKHSNYDNSVANSYDVIKDKIYLKTNLNIKLLDNLLKNNNKIFICGEAKTHCVKSSIIDLLDYVENNKDRYDPKNIILISNATSPISGSGIEDDIQIEIFKRGGRIAQIVNGELIDGCSQMNYFTNYNEKKINSIWSVIGNCLNDTYSHNDSTYSNISSLTVTNSKINSLNNTSHNTSHNTSYNENLNKEINETNSRENSEQRSEEKKDSYKEINGEGLGENEDSNKEINEEGLEENEDSNKEINEEGLREDKEKYRYRYEIDGGTHFKLNKKSIKDKSKKSIKDKSKKSIKDKSKKVKKYNKKTNKRKSKKTKRRKSNKNKIVIKK